MHRESLPNFLAKIEAKVGLFHLDYFTAIGKAESIPFPAKPAQAMIRALGGKEDASLQLSIKEDGRPLQHKDNPDIVIPSFVSVMKSQQKQKNSANQVDEQIAEQLIIPGAIIDSLLKSAKIYINPDLLSEEDYRTAIGNLQSQDEGKNQNGAYWQNVAVGVCHAQHIYLLCTYQTQKRYAIMHPRLGEISKNEKPILLLSNPALNFCYGKAKTLTFQEVAHYIVGMYRNLFQAASQEGKKYIVMPAAGLGVFAALGDKNLPSWYFEALMNVAKEFPALNIIYHPGSPNNNQAFQAALSRYKPQNVVQATKDVVAIAQELANQGYDCALHNPSDADVIYGVGDVGQYWKRGTGAGYVLEENFGATSTAGLGSRGLNPQAYQNIKTISSYKYLNFNQLDKSKPISLYFTGSFNPPTPAHIMTLVQAAQELEREGYQIANLYLSPSHDNYVGTKGYPALKIDGVNYTRPRLLATARIEISQALLAELKKQNSQNRDILRLLNCLSIDDYESTRAYFVDHPLLVPQFQQEKNEQLVYLSGQDLLENCCIHHNRDSYPQLVAPRDMKNAYTVSSTKIMEGDEKVMEVMKKDYPFYYPLLNEQLQYTQSRVAQVLKNKWNSSNSSISIEEVSAVDQIQTEDKTLQMDGEAKTSKFNVNDKAYTAVYQFIRLTQINEPTESSVIVPNIPASNKDAVFFEEESSTSCLTMPHFFMFSLAVGIGAITAGVVGLITLNPAAAAASGLAVFSLTFIVAVAAESLKEPVAEKIGSILQTVGLFNNAPASSKQESNSLASNTLFSST